MNANGITHIAKLKKPSNVLAHATPSFPYIGVAANGNTAPKMDRVQLDAARAEAAKISYASVK